MSENPKCEICGFVKIHVCPYHNKQKTFIVDMDSVLSDCTDLWLNLLNKKLHLDMKYEDITHFHKIEEMLAEKLQVTREVGKKFADDILNGREFFYNQEPIPGGIDAINFLIDEYEDKIVIGTKAPTDVIFGTGYTEKYHWLKKHFERNFPKMKYVCTGDKECISGDYLIDDAPKNIEKSKGIHKTIIFTHPWNINTESDYRINNWQDIYKLRPHL